MIRFIVAAASIVACIVEPASAQWLGPNSPDSLSIQGVLTDEHGVVVPNGNYSLLFKMYKGSTKIWQQNKASVPVSNGVFSVILGGSGSTSLDTVAFNVPIKLGVAVNGGSEMTPRTPLTAAPYALAIRGLYAVDAENGGNEAPNLLGGDSNNYISADVVGATISGGGGFASLGPGGSTSSPNSVTGHWGTVSGGRTNTAGRNASVGGGSNNEASGIGSAIAGGTNNHAGGGSFVGGGTANYATGLGAMIPGGYWNAARGAYSFAAGAHAKANHDYSFVWNTGPADADTFATSAVNQFLVRAPGGVGINENAPLTTVHVVSEHKGVSTSDLSNDKLIVEAEDAVVGAYSGPGGSWGSAFVLAEMGPNNLFPQINELKNKWTIARNTTGGSSYLRFTFGTDPNYADNNTVMRIEPGGNVRADGSFIGSGADVAEAVDMVGAFEAYEPGDVLVVSSTADRTFERSSSPYSTTVAGVYATSPGMLLHPGNIETDLSAKIPLAVVGIVPTKVTVENGPIRRGDLLVTSSSDGQAMKADLEKLAFGMVIGKALADFDGPGSGTIEVLVNVK